MSRNWVITVVVLLSSLGVNFNFVSASGIVSARIIDFKFPHPFIPHRRPYLRGLYLKSNGAGIFNSLDDRLYKLSVLSESFRLSRYPVEYLMMLDQPNTKNMMFESVPKGTRSKQKLIILRFKKWTGVLSCTVAIQMHVLEMTFTGHFCGIFHVGVADHKTEFTLSQDIRNLTLLKLYIRVTCDRFYFGADCSRHCRPQDGPRGHYDCTAAGHKRCRPNWRRAATNCTEPDPCRPSRCRNGAVCTETPDASFVCHCPRAFRGRLCEVPRSPCELAGPCRHGGRCVNVNGFAVCRCPGPRCQIGGARSAGHDGRAVSPERRSGVVFAVLLLAAVAAVVVLVVVGLMRLRRTPRRAVCRPPLPLQVGWRSGRDERVSSCETITTLAP